MKLVTERAYNTDFLRAEERRKGQDESYGARSKKDQRPETEIKSFEVV